MNAFLWSSTTPFTALSPLPLSDKGGKREREPGNEVGSYNSNIPFSTGQFVQACPETNRSYGGSYAE